MFFSHSLLVTSTTVIISILTLIVSTNAIDMNVIDLVTNIIAPTGCTAGFQVPPKWHGMNISVLSSASNSSVQQQIFQKHCLKDISSNDTPGIKDFPNRHAENFLDCLQQCAAYNIGLNMPSQAADACTGFFYSANTCIWKQGVKSNAHLSNYTGDSAILFLQNTVAALS